MPKSKFPFAETENSQLKKGLGEVHYSAHRHYYGYGKYISRSLSSWPDNLDFNYRQLRIYRNGVLMLPELDFSPEKKGISWVKPVDQSDVVFIEWAVYDRICPDSKYSKDIAREAEILIRKKPISVENI